MGCPLRDGGEIQATFVQGSWTSIYLSVRKIYKRRRKACKIACETLLANSSSYIYIYIYVCGTIKMGAMNGFFLGTNHGMCGDVGKRKTVLVGLFGALVCLVNGAERG